MPDICMATPAGRHKTNINKGLRGESYKSRTITFQGLTRCGSNFNPASAPLQRQTAAILSRVVAALTAWRGADAAPTSGGGA